MIKILMLSAGVITGSFQRVYNIIESCSKSDFKFYVTHKPLYSMWEDYEIKRLKKVGAVIVELRGKKLFDPFGIIDIAKIIRRDRIDIVHSWDVLGIFGRIIGKTLGARVINEWQNPPPEVGKEMSVKHYYINLISSVFVDGYISRSQELIHKYFKKRQVVFSGKMIASIPNFIDIEEIVAIKKNKILLKEKLALSKNGLVFTTIGYFNAQKAHHDIIAAFVSVRSVNNDCKLIIVGWGDLERQLKTMVKNFKIEKDVIFAGKCTREEVFQILSITDIFLLASHWEGFGFVFLEAMAMSIPIVATATDGASQVIEDGKTGYLVPIQNPHIMAEKILDLIKNPYVMEKMGKEGKQRVMQCFNRYNFKIAHEKFYKKIM